MVQNLIRLRWLKTSLLIKLVQLARATRTHVTVLQLIIVEDIDNPSFGQMTANIQPC